MKYWFPIFILALHSAAHAAILPPGFIETPLATGLDPTAMVQTPDGRIFIAEKKGSIRVVEQDLLLTDPLITLPVDNFNERGLSGITLHPDFAQNGLLYVYYTAKNLGRNRLSRLKVFGNYADPMSEEVLLEGDLLSGTIHNGGALVFGIDGKLYIALGDGANSQAAQSHESLLGKMLRLNDDGSIPEDNPFYQQNNGIYRAIWATGLRNPFSVAVQPGTGKIFACDVGSEYFEEVNDIEKGKDYGWNVLEGKRSWQDMPDNYRDPLYAYSHSLGCAIVGATFYNPPVAVFPTQYRNRFYFADYCKNNIRMLNPVSGVVSGTFASQIDRPLALLTGNNGELYYLSRGGLGGGSEADNTSSNEGMLWKVEYVGNGAPVFSRHPENLLISVGEDAAFAVQVNGTTPIHLKWYRDGVEIPDAVSTDLILEANLLSDSGTVIKCIATNPFGQVESQEALLRVTANKRPEPMISSPAPGLLYEAGVPVYFGGFAHDPETGLLGADELSWRIDLHHDDHTHPGMEATPGIDQGQFTLPTLGETAENVWMRIYLTARDQAGLTRTVHRDVFPKKSTLHIASIPDSLNIRVDGKTHATPFQSTTVRGLRRLIEPARLIALPDQSTWVFDHWDDGGVLPTRILYPSDSAVFLTAVYEPVTYGKGRGLYGTYYNSDAQSAFADSLFSRIDPVVNFDWMNGAPDSVLMLPDQYAVRWVGEIEPLFDAEYTFIVASDDGCRLWVNGEQIIDLWIDKPNYEAYGKITLEKGQRYPVILEYYESAGGASAKLMWSTSAMSKRLIPSSQLYPILPRYTPDVAARMEYDLYPNPVGQVAYLRFRASHQEVFDLWVVDAMGRRVKDWQGLNVNEPDMTVALGMQELPSGRYWLEMRPRNFGEPRRIPFVKP